MVTIRPCTSITFHHKRYLISLLMMEFNSWGYDYEHDGEASEIYSLTRNFFPSVIRKDEGN